MSITQPDLASLKLITQTLPFLHLSPTGALFFPLPAPHSHVILSGPDPADGAEIVQAFNDPLIYRWTISPPFPYLLAHAEDMLRRNVHTYEESVSRMSELVQKWEGMKLAATPLRFIREVQRDGSWKFIGDVGLVRCSFSEVFPLEERDRLVRENNAREAGDEGIVWMIGDYLISSHHGRGIMTAAIRTLLQTWARPLMSCRTVRAYVLTGNEGSKRVFEKLGFELKETMEGGVPMQGKREEVVGMWVMEWRYGS
ncbi:acyl-CoA N-acyltransferase [Dacryopinax primogenitus]|uniref:Acyl-CoA N-acyltransferase n=1 Tax=Dacryopinax primogenitus (strain DJM 731) TaxID=1858805 RepID=M5FWQ7_DACPD|nr:acyl-CoA N-acyltransferase [Dacryopinax primogenitus]EJU00829.1 acyl-CoA N-acyltransferase [Dacryopinax primogenitus]